MIDVLMKIFAVIRNARTNGGKHMGKRESRISYGMIGKWFYVLEQVEGREGDYYSLYMIDEMPKDLEQGTIQRFIEEHRNESGSVADDWEGIMEELGRSNCV